jgi:hypothetical protein
MDDLSTFIRFAVGQPSATDDYADRIKAITGSDYPPKTLEGLLRLLMKAGFSQSEANSVFRYLGYDGYDHAEELPRPYASVAGRFEGGRVVPIDDPLLLSQRILAGLEARVDATAVKTADGPELSAWFFKAEWRKAWGSYNKSLPESTFRDWLRKHGETDPHNNRRCRFRTAWLNEAEMSIPPKAD